MKYLLDTNICIALLRGNRDIEHKIESVGYYNCFLSEITVAELIYGAYKSGNTQNVIKTQQFIDIFD